MYIEKAIFVNRAPFERLELDFKSQGVNVLTAVNGKGKTTILSHIVDAFHEMARSTFSNSFEGKEGKYYRLSSGSYNLNQTEHSFVYLRFRDGGTHYDYVDISGQCNAEQYDAAITVENKISFSKLQSSLQQLSRAKHCAAMFDEKSKKDVFQNNILTYFPAYRYEQPGYLNDPYKINLKFRLHDSFDQELPNPIEVISGLKECANWIMDVAFDNYRAQLTRIMQWIQPTSYSSSSVPSSDMMTQVNSIVSASVSSSAASKCSNVQLGIGSRTKGDTRLSLVDSDTGRPVFPSIFNLSSGELSIICIFCELLRQADKIEKQSDVSGIVLIDEVDKHLHIKLQKEILPKMFDLFPNVQFIVSSHSPFLNMGLADELLERSHVIDLDKNGIVCSPTNNEQYTEVYNMMIKENERFAEAYQELKVKIASSTKPLIITEGKTDVKHIQKAQNKLLKDTDADIDIEYHVVPDDWGSSKLKTLLENLSLVKQQRKIIGIFDRDEPTTIVNDIEKDGQPYKSYGNNIFAFCIQLPEDRKKSSQTKISIEYLYSDDEIKTPLETGRRLFFGTEFKKDSPRHITEDWVLNMPDGRGNDKILESTKEQAVYDKDGNNKLATKNDFADAVCNENKNFTVSQESWDNFRPLFDRIRTILNHQAQ